MMPRVPLQIPCAHYHCYYARHAGFVLACSRDISSAATVDAFHVSHPHRKGSRGPSFWCRLDRATIHVGIPGGPCCRNEYRVDHARPAATARVDRLQTGKLSMDLFARAVEAVRTRRRQIALWSLEHSMCHLRWCGALSRGAAYPATPAALGFVDGLVTVPANAAAFPLWVRLTPDNGCTNGKRPASG